MGRPDRPAQHAQAYPLDIISTSAGTAGRSVEPCRFAHLVPPAARESPGLNPGLAHHADQVSRQPLRQPESLLDGPLLSVPRPSQRPVGALDPIGHHSPLAGSLPAVRLRPPVDVRHPTESRWRLQVTSFQGLGPEFGQAPRIDPLLPAGCHQRPIRRRLPVPPDLPQNRLRVARHGIESIAVFNTGPIFKARASLTLSLYPSETLLVTVEASTSCPPWNVPTEGRRYAATTRNFSPDEANRGRQWPRRVATRISPDYSWNMLIRASDPAFSCGRSPVSLEPLSIRLNRLENRTIEPVINRLPARGTVTRRQVDFPVRNPHRFGPFHGPDASAVHYPGAQDTRASLCHNRFQSVAP